MSASNLVNIDLSPKLVEEIKNQTNQLHSLLDFTIVLTPDERHSLPAMGDKTVAFVEKALDMAKGNPHLLPPYLDVPELERDLNTAKMLSPIITDLEIMLSKLKDTSLAAGSEAYTAALTFYSTVKSAQKNNISGAEVLYNELKQRFPGRGKSIKSE